MVDLSRYVFGRGFGPSPIMDVPIGPYVRSQPAGSVSISPPWANVQTAIDANPGATTFWLTAGTYTVTGSGTPKSNNTFIGQYGAILDGTGWSTSDDTAAPFRALDQGISSVTVSNLVIQNMPQCGVHGVSYGAADADPARNWTVEHCEIHDSPQGIVLANMGCRILYNYVHDCSLWNYAINRHVDNTTLFLLPCEIAHNHFATGGATQKAINTHAPIHWHHNYVHGSAKGLWNDGNGAGSVFEYNTLEDCSVAALQWEHSMSGIIRYNTFTNNGGNGLFISTSGLTEVYGNTFVDNQFTIDLLVDCQSVNAGFSWAPDLRDNSIHDNVIYVPSGGYGGVFEIPSSCPSGPVTSTPYTDNTKNNVFDGNTYYVFNPTGVNFFWQANKTAAQWQALPQDATSTINQR